MKVYWIFAFATRGIAWCLAIFFSFHSSETPQVLARYSWKYFIFLSGFWGLACAISIANVEKWFERRGSQFALVFGALCLTFGLLEAIVRLVDAHGISYYEEVSRYRLEMVADPEMIFRHRRSWSSTYSGVEVRLNELGLRDDPIVQKTKREYRIVVLGDSVTFGWGVAQDQIFTSRLQRTLTEKIQRPIRVINTGVGGYNTVQENAFFKKHGLSLAPDMVILVYVTNDVETNERPFDPWSSRSFSGKSPPQMINLLLGKSWLFRLARHGYQYRQSDTTDPESYRRLRETPGWLASMRALKDMSDTCNDIRVPLYVFYFRWKATPYNSALLEDAKKILFPNNVQDMSGWFVGRDLHEQFNSRVDPHPNSQGHKVISDNIADYLLSTKLFSEAHVQGLLNF